MYGSRLLESFSFDIYCKFNIAIALNRWDIAILFVAAFDSFFTPKIDNVNQYYGGYEHSC